MAEAKSVNVWLGAEIGILKAVNLVGKTATNYFDQERIGKEYEIVSTCWSKKKDKICCGMKNGFVRDFNMDSSQFSDPVKVPEFKKGAEHIVKVYHEENNLLSCTTKGRVVLWNPKAEDSIKLQSNVGPDVFDFAVSDDHKFFATGGKENALKIYDIENPTESIFKAKNVPHDWLQLRVPIWVTGVKFLHNSNSKIVTSTGTSKIRLYDITGEQRRPCLEMNFDEYPLTAITLTNNPNQVIVGNTRGNVGMFDFRKKALVRVYKGFAGSVRCLQTHPNLDYIASCGLDRYLRIHEVNSGKLEYKVYLKARLNSVLFSDLDFVAEKLKAEDAEEDMNRKRKLEELDESEDDDDPVWRKMKMADSENFEGSSDEEQ